MTARLLLALLLLVAAAAMAWLAVYQVDDAFIVYRYADHLARGHGLVFNPGERVEGVTCLLWAVLLAPASLAGLSLPRVAPIATACCGLATLALVVRRAAEARGRRRIEIPDLLPAVLLLALPAFAYWSVGALETIPFTLLLAAAARDHALEVDDPERKPRSALWLGLAAWTRPETPLVVAALALDRLARRRAGLLRWAGTFLALALPLLVVRRAYYGDWLPNTYYAKTGGALGPRLALGVDYVLEAAASIVPAFGLRGAVVTAAGVALVAVLLAVGGRTRALRPEAWSASAILAACVYEGGDWMVLNRLAVPALPALALVAGTALARVPRLLAAVATLTLVAHGAVAAAAERNGPRGLAANAEGYRYAHLAIARAIAERAAPGDLVALMDVGMIGWELRDQRILDVTGLTDRRIARAPGGFLEKRYPASEVLGRDPRFLVLVPRFTIDERIHADPSFAARYRLVLVKNHRFNWSPPSAYELNLFERVGR